MHTLGDATDIMQRIVPEAKAMGWAVALGGSIPLKGTSKKDIDLIFFPYKVGYFGRRRWGASPAELISHITAMISAKVVGVPDHRVFGDYKLVVVVHCDNGIRLDFIFPTENFRRRPKYYTVLNRRKPLKR